jgi:hypothetical protein
MPGNKRVVPFLGYYDNDGRLQLFQPPRLYEGPGPFSPTGPSGSVSKALSPNSGLTCAQQAIDSFNINTSQTQQQSLIPLLSDENDVILNENFDINHSESFGLGHRDVLDFNPISSRFHQPNGHSPEKSHGNNT